MRAKHRHMPRNDVNLVKTKIYCNKSVDWSGDFI